MHWIYRPTPEQLAVFRRSCDRRFGGFKPPDCAVSAYANEGDGSYLVMRLQGQLVIIDKSYMSFAEAKEISDDLRRSGLAKGS